MSVEFKGAQFEARDNVNRMRSLYLAKLARDGQRKIDEAERTKNEDLLGPLIMEQNAALYDYVQHALRSEDFDRFMAVCDEQGVTDRELYEFTAKMIGAAAERPTGPLIASSDGPSTAPESSVSRLEQLATERYPGRPDMVLAATAGQRISDEETAKVLDLWASAS